jgi:hypothetical protein
MPKFNWSKAKAASLPNSFVHQADVLLVRLKITSMLPAYKRNLDPGFSISLYAK